MRAAGKIGRAIRNRRRDLGLDQAEVARRAGVSSSQVSKIERGHNATLRALLAVMDSVHLELVAEEVPLSQAVIDLVCPERDRVRLRAVADLMHAVLGDNDTAMVVLNAATSIMHEVSDDGLNATVPLDEGVTDLVDTMSDEDLRRFIARGAK